MSESIIGRKSFAFAIQVIRIYKSLVGEKREYVMSKQFLRSGTAVGALVREAQNAESKADFIHKLAIAQKECDESIYWIELLYHTQYMSQEAYGRIQLQGLELLKMIRSAIITTKQRHLSRKR